MSLVVRARIKARLLRAGVSEQYLWDAFTYLAQLDMPEPMQSTDGLRLFGRGWFVELEYQGDRWTLQQNWRRELVISAWKPDARPIDIGYGVRGRSNWYEIYRSRTVADAAELTKVTAVIRRLYGDGPSEMRPLRTLAEGQLEISY